MTAKRTTSRQNEALQIACEQVDYALAQGPEYGADMRLALGFTSWPLEGAVPLLGAFWVEKTKGCASPEVNEA